MLGGQQEEMCKSNFYGVRLLKCTTNGTECCCCCARCKSVIYWNRVHASSLARRSFSLQQYIRALRSVNKCQIALHAPPALQCLMTFAHQFCQPAMHNTFLCNRTLLLLKGRKTSIHFQQGYIANI
jgi:hypothetical protein